MQAFAGSPLPQDLRQPPGLCIPRRSGFTREGLQSSPIPAPSEYPAA
ncbi:hypothetical protein PRJ_4868 [Pseudomonas sp. XWY-1]|nr:hypothetical protein PRJ_4868 [Pseudomonas sp. XWY-1]